MDTFIIDGEQFSAEKIIRILHEQILQIPEYSHFEDAMIEFCRINKADELFFYVSNDNGEDMMVKISQEGTIYWDWTGQVMDD